MTVTMAIGAAATDLRATFGAGRFLIQVVGEQPVGLAEAAAAPAAGDGHRLQRRETWTVTIAAIPMWAWSPTGGSRIAVSPA